MNSFRLSVYVLLMAVLLLSAGCYKPSETDTERLNLLKNEYGNKFYFKLEGQFYLSVRLKYEAQVDEEELREVYRTFFFDEIGRTRRDTSYVYLNFHNLEGEFQYQIAYSRIRNKFVKNNAEYY